MGHRSWNFDIDRFLNPFVPAPPWRHIPYPIAWWFGYRKTKPEPTGNLMPVFWAFIGVFCAITIIEAVSMHVPAFLSRDTPIIVGSFGAAAVLEFYAIEAPLAQPRNAILGQLLSAFVGIAVAKLFRLSDRFDEINYLGGALACAAATSLMALTKTVHPPAGATALLAVVDSRLVQLGWFLLPVMALGCGLMCGVALLINNIERQFPIYWWTPVDLRQKRPMFLRRKKDPESGPAEDAGEDKSKTPDDVEKVASAPQTNGSSAGDDDAKADEDAIQHHKHGLDEVIIRPGQVIVPHSMYLTQEETQLLETLSKRI